MSEVIFENYKNQRLFLISGLDSIGVPYTPDNYMLYSYTDFLVSEFKKNNVDIECFNLSSLAISKTHELIKILKRNYSREYYTRLNKRITKHIIDTKKYNRPLNARFMDKYFQELEKDINITTELINAENPIFILSCGAMDLKKNLDLYSYDPKKYIPKIARKLFKEIKETMTKIEECFKFILELNPSTTIYMLGVYPLAKNKIKETILYPFVLYYNKKLEEMCLRYPNVCYVNIMGTKNYMAKNDGHPSLDGHKFISEQIVKTMNKNMIK